MKRLMTLAVVAVVAVSVTNFAFAEKVKQMKIVSFTGQVQVKLADGSIIGVVPGAPVPEIPAGAEVIVVSGQAVFSAGGTIVTAAKGDSFTFNTSGNTVSIAATGTSSAVKVSVGGTEAKVVSGNAIAVKTAGKTSTLTAATGAIPVTANGVTTTLAEGASSSVDTPTTASAGTAPATGASAEDEGDEDAAPVASEPSTESVLQNVDTLSPSAPQTGG